MSIGFNCVRASIVDLLNENASLAISHCEMTTVGEAVGAFIVWPKKLITLDTQVR